MVIGSDSKHKSLVFLNALDLVAPSASDFDREVYGLGAAAPQSDLIEARDFANLPTEFTALLDVNITGGHCQSLTLLDHGLRNLGVAMALVAGSHTGIEVNISLAINVPEQRSLAPFHHNGMGGHAFHAVSRLSLEALLCGGTCLGFIVYGENLCDGTLSSLQIHDWCSLG